MTNSSPYRTLPADGVEAAPSKPYRVALVSTWGAECGIATYSEDLSTWLTDEGVRLSILAPLEPGTCLGRTRADVPATVVWSRQGVDLGPALLAATEGVDIVHFQHEHGLFQNVAALFQALTDLRKAGRKTVVTLHTVHGYGDWQGTGFADNLRKRADCIIVHTPACLAAVSLAQGTAPVVWVPHGTRVTVKPGVREEGLKYMNIPEAAWSGCFGGAFGFINGGKNLLVTVQAFADGLARRLIPRSCGLIICGREALERDYMMSLQSLINATGFTGNIFLRPRFVPRDMVPHIMAAFDFGVLNTTSAVLSASGQVHLHAAYGVPFAAARRPIYDDACAAGGLLFTLDAQSHPTDLGLINALAALGSSESVRRAVKAAVLAYGARTGWNHVAKQHAEIYRRVLQSAPG